MGHDSELENSSIEVTLPLVVDLDGTLLLTDSLNEQFIKAFFTNPLLLLVCLVNLRRGRAAFKAALADKFPLDVDTIPINELFVMWLRERREQGRELHLCTAAHQSIADSVAARTGVFNSAVGSQAVNLKSQTKADHLVRRFPAGFVYAGDSHADLAVWRRAEAIVLAGSRSAVDQAARALGKPIEASFPVPSAGLKDWIRAIRVHHWSKNALVFVPLLLGHDWNSRWADLHVFLGFLVLLMLISSTYLINDLADLDSDRAHWSKRRRPIASGRIPVMAAFLAGIAGISLALILGFLISLPFDLALGCYLAITLGYSFGLKQVPLLDTFIIGVLFTVRIIMGTALAGQVYSQWLLAFSMMFFFSLATAKRQTELLRAVENGRSKVRGYRAEDILVNATFGVATGISSLIIMALYFADASFQHSVYYHRPAFLWIMPMLVGILVGRVWLLAQRGEMHDDPVSFAVRDPAMLGLAIIAVIVFILAL
jgi:4-hydroxybenzoate polyprenyltransferase